MKVIVSDSNSLVDRLFEELKNEIAWAIATHEVLEESKEKIKLNVLARKAEILFQQLEKEGEL